MTMKDSAKDDVGAEDEEEEEEPEEEEEEEEEEDARRRATICASIEVIMSLSKGGFA